MNEIFLKRMKEMLKDEYPDYVKTLEEKRFRGLRVNTLKGDVDTFQTLYQEELRATPFCNEAFYIDSESEHVGSNPLHLSGAFYMQEPSATSAVEVLDVQKDDWVLDLCAAPGGKSTQIAAKLQHTGFLVSNEIESKRAQILLSNLERVGASANAILNAHPKDVCTTCAGWFDKVLVDAPCSGEGMFKKHSAAMDDWSEAHVQACANRQIQILQSAYEALKAGGILVYSTCTYALEENEQVVARFLAMYPDMEQIDCNVQFGRCGYETNGMNALQVRRIFPMDQGEGHFIAKFQKRGNQESIRQKEYKSDTLPKAIQIAIQSIVDIPSGCYRIHQNRVYFKTTPFLDYAPCKVLREGIMLGEIIKNRFEPHQHLFMSAYLKPYLKQICHLDEASLKVYLSGNQLMIPGYRGYVGCAYQGQILGFGKGDGNVIKNKYPKGLRQPF